MAHSGKTITFATDLLPNEDNIYSLGTTGQRWKVYGDIKPIASKTYTNVIATSNDQPGAGFFYAKVRASSYDTIWHTKMRITASVPGNTNFYATSIYDLWGTTNTYLSYKCQNAIRSTSYRPLYYNCHFRVNSTGYNNGMGGWLGFSLFYANSPTDTNLKRTVTVELLQYENCTVELQDTLITPTNIPNRTTSGYYNSAYNSYDNFDFCNQGLKETGDDTGNDADRTLQNLMYFRFTTGAAGIGRYTLLMEESTGVYSSLTTTFPNTNTPLSTLTMNTGVKYKLGRIIYFNQNVNRAANTNMANNTQYFTAYDLIDIRYTFQLAAGAITAYKPFYMVGTLDSDGLFTINPASTAWTQTLPDNPTNGVVYVYLGTVYNDTNPYRITLELHHPIYTCKNTQINPGNISGSAAYVPLSGVTGADDLKAIEALTGTSGLLKKTAANTWTLDTSSYVTSSGVTSVATGAGLTGGTITGTGTIKADLTSETKLTNAAADGTETSGRVYPVRLDKNGKLAVNVPWTDTSHYSAYLYAGANNATAHAAVSSGTNIYLCLRENNSQRSAVQIKQGNNMTISSDANGIITFASSYSNTLMNYTLGATTRAYLMGSQNAPSTTTTARAAHGDMGVYLSATAGQLSAKSLSLNDGAASASSVEKVWMQWNNTDQALEFVFA